MATYFCTVDTLEAVMPLCDFKEFSKLSAFITTEMSLYGGEDQRRLFNILRKRFEELTYPLP